MYLCTYIYSCVVKALVGSNTELITVNILPSREKLRPRLHSSIKLFGFFFFHYSLNSLVLYLNISNFGFYSITLL